jgi:hypothetical protein
MSPSCLAPTAATAVGPRFFAKRIIPGSSALVRIACGAALAVGVMLSASSALAGGFWIYEMGTPDLGTASAGRAASAKDAATVFGNQRPG